jgi:hypothetical protein
MEFRSASAGVFRGRAARVGSFSLLMIRSSEASDVAPAPLAAPMHLQRDPIWYFDTWSSYDELSDEAPYLRVDLNTVEY